MYINNEAISSRCTTQWVTRIDSLIVFSKMENFLIKLEESMQCFVTFKMIRNSVINCDCSMKRCKMHKCDILNPLCEIRDAFVSNITI